MIPWKDPKHGVYGRFQMTPEWFRCLATIAPRKDPILVEESTMFAKTCALDKNRTHIIRVLGDAFHVHIPLNILLYKFRDPIQYTFMSHRLKRFRKRTSWPQKGI